MTHEWNTYTPAQARALADFHATYGRQERENLLQRIPPTPCEIGLDDDEEKCTQTAHWRFNGIALCREDMQLLVDRNAAYGALLTKALAAHILVPSTNRGRFSLDDPQYGADLTCGDRITLLVQGHWITGQIEHHRTGYSFASPTYTCDLQAGMQVRCMDEERPQKDADLT